MIAENCLVLKLGWLLISFFSILYRKMPRSRGISNNHLT
uniref:Uncharacterized protein n=1 Tax=Klebsiella pneumoniae TaxID=573 RepID=A0A8B0SVX4_KLEPN|nr:hypothetical protein [Klebsiella pneumoniae]